MTTSTNGSPAKEKKVFGTLVGVKDVDVLGELGALVSPSLPQSSEQTQPPGRVPYHAPV